MKHVDQKPIIKAFLEGHVSGSKKGEKPRHIETIVSNIFIFPQKAYKIYKNDNDYFNNSMWDVNDLKKRRIFYEEDFRCNKTFSPSVYKKLRGYVLRDGTVSFVDPKKGDDLVIQMNTIQTNKTLSGMLMDKKISLPQAEKVGEFFGKKAPKYKPTYKPKLKPADYFDIRVRDIAEFMNLEKKYVSKEEKRRVNDVLSDLSEKTKQYFLDYPQRDLAFAPDCHTDNMYISNHDIFFLDMFTPKVEWQFTPMTYTSIRAASDFFVLQGVKSAKAFLRGFYKSVVKEDVSPELEKFYLLQSIAIRGFYLYILSQANASRVHEADLYMESIREIEKNLYDGKHVIF